jgi:membrane-bound ClpP family serine protease
MSEPESQQPVGNPTPTSGGTTPTQVVQPDSEAKAATVTKADLVASLFEALGPEGKAEQKNKARAHISRYIGRIVSEHQVSSRYNILILYDESKMLKSDADSIYSAVTGFTEQKPLLLILHSDGGAIGAGYLIGKLLREYASKTLDIAVPRRAKSAATLLCCAADHIHMGSLSELGPIDPQIDGLPALGLKGAIQHLAELIKEHPKAVQLFSQYLSNSVKPIHLGYYERVAESAVQYAERLLKPHEANLQQNPAKIAKELVYAYKDHGFVIDANEAKTIFGEKVIKHNTEEYRLANSVYQGLVFISRIVEATDHDFYLIGSPQSDAGFLKKSTK